MVTLLVLAWSDLARLYRLLGERNYQNGSYRAAGDNWQRAVNLNSRDTISRFNRGVANYRLGNFSAARTDFDVLATDGTELVRQQALYNRGNCQVRQAEHLGSGQRDAAERLYREAIKSYQEAGRLKPGDSDVDRNLHAVTAAMTVIRGNKMKNDTGQKASAPRRSDVAQGKGTPAVQLPSPAASPSAGSAGKATSDNREGTVSRRKSMGREQAERLLNEKRGRETLPSSVPAPSRNSSQLQPAKDW